MVILLVHNRVKNGMTFEGLYYNGFAFLCIEPLDWSRKWSGKKPQSCVSHLACNIPQTRYTRSTVPTLPGYIYMRVSRSSGHWQMLRNRINPEWGQIRVLASFSKQISDQSFLAAGLGMKQSISGAVVNLRIESWLEEQSPQQIIQLFPTDFRYNSVGKVI